MSTGSSSLVKLILPLFGVWPVREDESPKKAEEPEGVGKDEASPRDDPSEIGGAPSALGVSLRDSLLRNERLQERFSLILKEADSLKKLSGYRARECCRGIGKGILLLISSIEEEVVNLERKEREFHEHLLESDLRCADASEQLSKTKKKYTEMESELVGLNRVRERMEEDIKKEEFRKYGHGKQTVEEGGKVVSAVADTIPVVGHVRVCLRGDFMGMIPFCTTVRGVTAAVKGTQHALSTYDSVRESNYLERMRNLWNERIQECEERISNIERELGFLRSVREKMEKDIKQIGKDLTIVRNIKSSLRDLLLKYGFLKGSAESLEILMDEECYEILGKGEKEKFIADLRKIQCSFQESLLGIES